MTAHLCALSLPALQGLQLPPHQLLAGLFCSHTTTLHFLSRWIGSSPTYVTWSIDFHMHVLREDALLCEPTPQINHFIWLHSGKTVLSQPLKQQIEANKTEWIMCKTCSNVTTKIHTHRLLPPLPYVIRSVCFYTKRNMFIVYLLSPSCPASHSKAVCAPSSTKVRSTLKLDWWCEEDDVSYRTCEPLPISP